MSTPRSSQMETKQRSRNQFCACGHNRSLTWVDPVERRRHPNVCSVPKCECVKHDTAVAPKKAKLTLVEPSLNAMALTEAVREIRDALASLLNAIDALKELS